MESPRELKSCFTMRICHQTKEMALASSCFRHDYTIGGKTSESVHCTILNKLCACQRMHHRPSARPLYRFGRLALSVHTMDVLKACDTCADMSGNCAEVGALFTTVLI